LNTPSADLPTRSRPSSSPPVFLPCSSDRSSRISRFCMPGIRISVEHPRARNGYSFCFYSSSAFSPFKSFLNPVSSFEESAHYYVGWLLLSPIPCSQCSVAHSPCFSFEVGRHVVRFCLPVFNGSSHRFRTVARLLPVLFALIPPPTRPWPLSLSTKNLLFPSPPVFFLRLIACSTVPHKSCTPNFPFSVLSPVLLAPQYVLRRNRSPCANGPRPYLFR